MKQPLSRLGISGFAHNSMSAIYDGARLGACAEGRARRIRTVGVRDGGWPVASIRMILQELSTVEPESWLTAEAGIHSMFPGGTLLPHHLGHARTSFFTSGFREALVLICDSSDTESESFWLADSSGFRRLPLPVDHQQGIAKRLSEACCDAGLAQGQVRELEFLARCGDDTAAHKVLSKYVEEVLRLALALHDVRSDLPLCVGGGLFYNGYLNLKLRSCEVFSEVYVPPDPGNSGLAIGCAMPEVALNCRTTAFLGPTYEDAEIKQVLDNCKLTYQYFSDAEQLEAVLKQLERGRLVGWFKGAMEWGPRALGHRSILANPFDKYVSHNLNEFLKHRPRHHTYSLSILEEEMAGLFSTSVSSPYMEADAELSDSELRFASVAHSGRRLRIQSVAASSDPFAALLRGFKLRAGVGALVNTSFNGFHEPIVVSPRDAIRVFFGTGLDALAIGSFWLEK
jgi:predicted NodU family carbamoyl transferase